MGNLMNQSDEESVFVQISIHRNLVLSSYRSAIISVACLALVDYLQMHIVAFDQLKARQYGVFGQVFLKDFAQKVVGSRL